MNFVKKLGVCFLVCVFMFGCAEDDKIKTFGALDEARLLLDEPENWYSAGRSIAGEHYSPLDYINDQNVAAIGLAWEYDAEHAFSASPLVLDGVMYARDINGGVHAIDAVSGQKIWHFDPKEQAEDLPCCGIDASALLVWDGKIYIVSRTGYLSALDAMTGEHVWSGEDAYLAVGGIQVAAGYIVVVGQTSKESKSVVRAYNPATGSASWELYVADERNGGGGRSATFANMVYDPEAGFLYTAIGSNNPSSSLKLWDVSGQNIIALSSIVAIQAQTGELQWTYRIAPSSTSGKAMPVTLATLNLDGEPIKAIMQAAADGFFYIIDRITGQRLSIKQYGGLGVARLQSHMSYHVRSGLAYIPVIVFEEGASGHVDPFIITWNPLIGKETRRVAFDADASCGGGLLSTAGNLMLQGDKKGYLNIYAVGWSSSVGEWGSLIERVYVGSCIKDTSISYAVNYTQYIAFTTRAGRALPEGGGGKVISLKLGGRPFGAEMVDREAYPSKIIRAPRD